LFADPESYDPAGVAKNFSDANVMEILRTYLDDLEQMEPFDAAKLESDLRARAESHHVSAGKLIHPLRLALTGKTVSPGLFELMEALGKEAVVRRIGKAIAGRVNETA